MSGRARIAAFAAVVIAMLALLGVAVAVVADRQAFQSTYRGGTPPPGLMLADFDLRSYTGRPVSRESLRGKVVALTFLETKCTEACPIIAAEVGRAMDLLSPDERRQVTALAISTHPGDDTPAGVRAFLRKQRALGKLDYLIGSEQELRPVWKRFQILSALESGDADTHSAPVRIFAPSGEWVSTLHAGVDLTPENFVHDVRIAARIGA